MIEIFIKFYEALPAFIKQNVGAFLFALYKPKIKKHFACFISSRDLVFDIGANFGHLTKVFLELGAQVICVEPQPSCIEVLKKKFDHNPRVTIIEKALSGKEGSLDLFVASKSPSLATLSRQWQRKGRFCRKTNWDRTIVVSVTTLDALIKEYGVPSFCKIDTEGFEERVVKGLSRPVSAVSFEFTREFLDTAKACAKYFALLGNCRFNYSLYNTYTLASDKWLDYHQLFAKLESKRSQWLCGDIYVKIS